MATARTGSLRVDERELLIRYHREGDREARDQLVKRFLPLAWQLARRYQRGREPLEDLQQVASLGLLKAIDRFDPDRGTALSSFAVPTILGELRRHFRDRTWAVHAPRDLQELSLKVSAAVDAHVARHGRQPTVEQIATQVNTGTEQVLEAMRVAEARHSASLHATIAADEEDLTLADTLGAGDDGFKLVEQRADLHELMRVLSDQQREAIRLRFNEDLTQAEIAQRLGCSQMQVSRLLSRGLTRMRKAAEHAHVQLA